MKIHSNAKLTPQGRQLLIDRVSGGMSVALACKSMGVSTATGYKWLRRARDGEPLTDHSSRPHTMPRKTISEVEEEVVKARIEKHLSPLNLERETGVPARTCARIVKRNKCPKLADIDRVTGELIQRGPVTNERYEKSDTMNSVCKGNSNNKSDTMNFACKRCSNNKSDTMNFACKRMVTISLTP